MLSDSLEVVGVTIPPAACTPSVVHLIPVLHILELR